ncbi:MAG: disulfide oxidoreductase, partial [Alphaproteobacteria bacterium]|nr:disulfide oxidoreductase [Alphaproteobacteria bacterium]
ATDAIGMGLNMDIDHVAFSALEKFDGVGLRVLKADEIGQIAGRAGRHMNDGTFGVTAEAETLDEETISRVESHRYEPVRVLQYRNSKLAFHALDALIASLEEPPPLRGLARARTASDLEALRILASHEDVRAMATAPASVRLLWDACQLPDFRKLSAEDHVRLVGQIYRHLMSDESALPEDWLARQIARLDETEGDVATLSGRLAQIRTWTYAAHRPGWVKDAAHWQGQTRAVEDRLSDALHARLTQRFIDRRTSVLMRSLRDDEFFDLVLDDSGGVSVSGEAVGKLDGFRFAPDARAEGIHGRTLRAVALKALDGEFARREKRLLNAHDSEISLSEHGRLWWDGAIVARLTAGASALEPGLELLADDHLSADMRMRLAERLRAWLTAYIATRLEPLLALKKAADAKPGAPGALPAEARGLAFQLCEALGALDRTHATMPADERAAARGLRGFGVRFARRSIFLPKLLRPQAASLLALLWGVYRRLEKLPPPPAPGLTSFERDDALLEGFLAAAGFRLAGPRAIRLDMLDRLEEELEAAAAKGLSAATALPRLVSLLGTDAATLQAVLAALGWQQVEVAGPEPQTVWRRAPMAVRPKAKPRHYAKAPRAAANPDSPFAGLKALLAAD